MEKLFFSYIMPLSAVGSLITILMIAIERVSEKYLSKRTLSSMWRIAAFFYIIPFGVMIPAKATEVIITPLPKLWWPAPLLMIPQNAQNAVAADYPLPFKTALCIVWFIGVVIYTTYQSLMLFRFSHIVKTRAVQGEEWEKELLSEILSHKKLQKVRLLRVDVMTSPVLFGILRPVILLPQKQMSSYRLKLALLHETAHLEHCDLWHKRLLLAVCALHWFSPFAHLLMCHSGKIFELACDECVAEKLNAEERREYAMAVVESAGRGFVSSNFSSTFSSSAAQMKRRLENIMNMKSSASFSKSANVTLIVVLIICGVFVSSACTAQAMSPEKVVLSATVPADVEVSRFDNGTSVDTNEDNDTSFVLPVDDKHYVSLGFGSYGHEGIDFISQDEGPIYAVAAGTVVKAESDDAYGNYVIIDHGDGMQTLYAHCSELLVREGERVGDGSEIAKIGSTGRSTGPHLHFELRVNGEAKDPTEMLPITLSD